MAIECRASRSFKLVTPGPETDVTGMHRLEFAWFVGREVDGVRAVRKRQLGDRGERRFRESAQP